MTHEALLLLIPPAWIIVYAYRRFARTRRF
jgi:hypothetical protein